MSVAPMTRIQSVVTGVAGSPYYLVGYFGTALPLCQNEVDAWHAFVTGNTDATTANYPVGATITTGEFNPIVDPTDGSIIASSSADPQISTGTGAGNFLPPSNQVLVQWRTGVYANRREIRGRTNIPCQSEAASTSDGRLEPLFQEGYNLRAASLISATDVDFVIWSKTNGEWQLVTSASTWNQFSVLRSRRD